MYDIERQEQIIDVLKQRNSISVRELSKLLYVSMATIRRDLNKMEQRGLVARSFGGVCLFKNQVNKETAAIYRAEEDVLSKRNLCNQVLPFLHHNMSLFLDCSTTVLNLVSLLNEFNNITIITNGISLANELIMNTHHDVILSGGRIQSNSHSMLGSIAIQTLQSLHADVAILSATALSLDFGFSESTLEQSHIKKAMIQNADQTIFLIAKRKFGKKAIAKTIDLKEVDVLITDTKPEEEFVAACEKHQVKLLY